MSAVKCGLNWYVAQPKLDGPDQVFLSTSCYKENTVPVNYSKEDFCEQNLSDEIWEQLVRDLSEENILQAQARSSTLSVEEKAELIEFVVEHGCLNWKKISDLLGMKNKREALIKFLRIKVMPDEDEEEEGKEEITKLTNMYSGNIK